MIEQPPSAPQRGTGLAFVQHWDWVAEKGLMPRNTAMGIRAAVSQILKIDQGWESLDIRSIEADGLIGRFRNLSDLSPGSLATYESRFRNGLESYLAYLDNPTTYQPKVRRASPQREAVRHTKTEGTRGAAVSTPPRDSSQMPGSPTPGARLVVYPFPVRPDVFAELKLPADLTADEADRLSAFLRAIAISDPSRDG